MIMNYRLGIDIGGTNTVLGLVDKYGRISGKCSVSTVGHSNIDSYIDSLAEACENMLPEDGRLLGVGVGAPCANRETGCIEGATDLPWHGVVPLASLIAKRFGASAVISNDANAAAAGEMMFGAAKGIRNFIMLTLGTGVGGGVVCDGNVLSGSRGFAGELGHVTLGKGYDRLCSCGRRGCLQMYCNGRGIVATALELLSASDAPSALRSLDAAEMTAADVMRAAQAGDETACEVYRITGRILGEATANFLALSDPEAVVLFGGVAKAGKLLTEPMKEAMEEHALFLYRDRVKILLSTLPDADAAVLGAAALVK